MLILRKADKLFQRFASYSHISIINIRYHSYLNASIGLSLLARRAG